MNSPSTVKLGPLRLSPSAAGAFYSFVSVVGYGTANACMRKLSESCELTWAICNKELITVAVVGPWLAWRIWRGKMTFPTGRPLAILVAAGLSTELIGNIGIQWGYEAVGLAVMIPANTAFVLVSTAILGWMLLGQHVSFRNAAVIGLLLVALVSLGYGSARAAGQEKAESQNDGTPAERANLEKPAPSAKLVAAAIAVACVSGTVFTLLAIALQHCVNAKTSLSAAVVIITGCGVATLGPISFCTAGATKLLATPAEHYLLMYTAGACNLVAFLALVRGLQLTTVMHVNMITNAGQVTLAALAGVFLFGEACNHWLALGVALMVVGIFAFGSPVSQEAVDAHV